MLGINLWHRQFIYSYLKSHVYLHLNTSCFNTSSIFITLNICIRKVESLLYMYIIHILIACYDFHYAFASKYLLVDWRLYMFLFLYFFLYLFCLLIYLFIYLFHLRTGRHRMDTIGNFNFFLGLLKSFLSQTFTL